jgi:hypothetical protein
MLRLNICSAWTLHAPASYTPLAPHPASADEAKGIDALLALAVAGEESAMALGSEEEEEGDVPAPRPRKAPKPRARRRSAADDEAWEEEEEPADAGAVDDDEEDEDFAPPPRRTPYSTPAKGARLPRPGSAHVTPRRSGSRGVGAGGLSAASPGLGLPAGLSPYLLGGLDSGGDMLDLGLADLGYITSPGGWLGLRVWAAQRCALAAFCRQPGSRTCAGSSMCCQAGVQLELGGSCAAS